MSIGEKRSVSLGDNTGESADLRIKVAYDAIRVVPIDPAPIEEPLPDEEPLPGEEPSTELPVPPEPTTDTMMDSTGGEGTQATPVTVDSGCNGMGAGASWFFLMAVFFRRRIS